MKYPTLLIIFLSVVVFCSSCQENTDEPPLSLPEPSELMGKYTSFSLKTDVSNLSGRQKSMIPLLIEAADIMDGLFWYEAYGEDREGLLASIENKQLSQFIDINYGPWDRLNGNAAFVEGVGAKPQGANFYPRDLTKAEFEASNLADKGSLYTFIRREGRDLVSVPYHIQFEAEVKAASALLKQAAELAENEGLKKYLNLRAEALLTDEYQESDMAWLDMKTNQIEVVIGPIETYEDQLFGYKAAHEAYVLVKDMEWSQRLAKYAQFLPELQEGLPVDPEYKAEKPGSDTELNAYDVVYYAGDCNAGSKTIAINLPNDEEVQLQKGTRRLQLKNAMQAKYEKILVPIADLLIEEDQRKFISFDAFFANTMFHEVAHGLGIKNTINGQGTVRKALKEHSSALEEGKADMLGLYMIRQLHQKGELDRPLEEYYVTFMASVFRSVRFGASSAHGKANMIRFNFFREMGAFTRDESSGKYTIQFEAFEKAMDELSNLILTLQGNGDYGGVAALVADKASIKEPLSTDLQRLTEAGIPVDIIFEQGLEQLGL